MPTGEILFFSFSRQVLQSCACLCGLAVSSVSDNSRNPAITDTLHVRRVGSILAEERLFDKTLDHEPKYAQGRQQQVAWREICESLSESTDEQAGVDRMSHVAICTVDYDVALSRHKSDVAAQTESAPKLYQDTEDSQAVD